MFSSKAYLEKKTGHMVLVDWAIYNPWLLNIKTQVT